MCLKCDNTGLIEKLAIIRKKIAIGQQGIRQEFFYLLKKYYACGCDSGIKINEVCRYDPKGEIIEVRTPFFWYQDKFGEDQKTWKDFDTENNEIRMEYRKLKEKNK